MAGRRLHDGVAVRVEFRALSSVVRAIELAADDAVAERSRSLGKTVSQRRADDDRPPGHGQSLQLPQRGSWIEEMLKDIAEVDGSERGVGKRYSHRNVGNLEPAI